MSFNDLVGQDLAKTILKRSLKADRLSHAYLFIGESGLGKDIAAFEFSKAINCHESEDDSCGECISCRKAVNNNHPDIKEIRPEGASIKIDQIRELQQEIIYKPYESKKKVYIIYSGDKMNIQAANSLLKTLEEPPSHAIIILLADNVNKILPTIISRCQLIRFKRVSELLIKDNIISNYGLDEKKADLITALSGGRYKVALNLIEDQELLQERDRVLDLIISFKGIDKVEAFSVVQDLLDDRERISQILDQILVWYRDLLVLKLNKEVNLVNIDYLDQLEKESNGWNIKGLEDIIKLIEETNNVIRGINVNLQLSLEVMMLKLIRLRGKNYDQGNRGYF
ncbi:DNA polymerase III subunit delta' [Halonatronum saccharophilum]|uniref:DNA polymerase III subunit delta' n=1 Tax=Halonatronum saccharophilum TaxID=150060 RepID=UPI000487F8FA|nr:DNA polymerase III subunit delta' [Halonatronum saccharophilum]